MADNFLDTVDIELENPNFLSQMEKLYEQVRDYDESVSARDIAVELERILESSDLKSGNEELYKTYQTLILKYRFAAMPVLKGENVKDLVGNNLAFGLELQEYDLKRYLDNFLLTLSDDFKVASYLTELEKAIESNQEDLSSLGQLGNLSSVSALVNVYNQETKQGSQDKEARRALDLSTFITKNDAVKKLDQKGQERVRKILDFYDWIKYAKAAPEPELDPEIASALKSVQKNAGKIVHEILEAEKALESTSSKTTPQATPVPSPPVSREPVQEKKAPAPPPVREERQQAVPRPSTPPPQGKLISKEHVDAVTASREAVAQLEKTSEIAHRASSQSLSQAIVNAGQEKTPEGEMRVGQKPGSDLRHHQTQTKKPVSKKSGFVPRPVEAAVKIPPSKPMSMAEGVGEILKNRPTPEIQKAKPLPDNVVNLSKKTPLNVSKITNPEDLSKISFSDVNSMGFDIGLNAIGQKVEQLAQEKSIPKNLVINNFYKSPLYETYVNMGVAVMNDKGGDQKAAFEKVLGNYKSARKDYLTRDQFLAVHALKKKMQQD